MLQKCISDRKYKSGFDLSITIKKTLAYLYVTLCSGLLKRTPNKIKNKIHQFQQSSKSLIISTRQNNETRDHLLGTSTPYTQILTSQQEATLQLTSRQEATLHNFNSSSLAPLYNQVMGTFFYPIQQGC